MKRSEMHDLIYEELFGQLNYHMLAITLDEYQRSLLLSCAADILDLIEEKGMLPPSISTGASGWEVGKGKSCYQNVWEAE